MRRSTSVSALRNRCRFSRPTASRTWLDALLADPAARVRMEAASRLPRDAAAAHAARLARGLGDPDGSVKAAALDAAAPLASGPAADPRRPGMRGPGAYGTALASREPDLVASALDAAASLAEGGCSLLAARGDDPGRPRPRPGAAAARREVRRERRNRFAPVARHALFPGGDYRRLARLGRDGARPRDVRDDAGLLRG